MPVKRFLRLLNEKIAFARMHSEKIITYFLIICCFGGEIIMEILMYPIVGLFGLLGGGSSIVIIVYLFMVLAQKIKNKILHGASLYD